uniref:Uncharacterized protein n=1 Tax=uncultured Methanosarcinales archaeon TaxID=183757 RepID=A0A7H1KNR3_9EURY|nr:hypothetical protein HCAOCCDF_00025 [uncultured Methanosarcinales archaeon]
MNDANLTDSADAHGSELPVQGTPGFLADASDIIWLGRGAYPGRKYFGKSQEELWIQISNLS